MKEALRRKSSDAYQGQGNAIPQARRKVHKMAQQQSNFAHFAVDLESKKRAPKCRSISGRFYS